MTLCDPKFAAVLSDYNDRLARETKIVHDPEALKTIDVNDFLIPVGEEVGRLMHSLVVGLNARIIVELGTSYGYSTLFLADAARATGGKVYSYDVAAEKQGYATEQLKRADLAATLERIARDGDPGYTGTTAGLNPSGFLLVAGDDGQVHTVLSGGIREP